MVKIDYLESKLKSLGIYSDELSIALELINAYSLPVVVAVESASRLISIFASEELDPISRDVLKALSTCEKMSISELTRRVRIIRGSASRRIIRNKLVKLVEKGYVDNIGSENRPLFILKKCLEK